MKAKNYCSFLKSGNISDVTIVFGNLLHVLIILTEKNFVLWKIVPLNFQGKVSDAVNYMYY